MNKEPESVFVLHDSAYEAQCGGGDTISVFLTIEEARAELEDKAERYKDLENFKMLEDECTALCGDWFYRLWIETVPISHHALEKEQLRN